MLQELSNISDIPHIRPIHPSGEHGDGVLRPHTPFRAETRPDVIAQLEWLDDLMFAAIDGDPVALEAAALALASDSGRVRCRGHRGNSPPVFAPRSKRLVWTSLST